MRTGRADLPLHTGKAPAWLFSRMTLLAREMSLAIIGEEGPPGLFRRLSDPFWFQAFGSVLGFDWHSSGVTTTACGALKEGLRGLEKETGVVIAGGKGAASRKTPSEIEKASDKFGIDSAPLVNASRLSAKVDSSALQDGFQVYHHTFMFTPSGEWAVVQQGMNEVSGMARRYHWLTSPRFDSDPHAAVTEKSEDVLNLVASESESNRKVSAELAREGPDKVIPEIIKMRTLEMPRHHAVKVADLHPERLGKILTKAYEAQPADFTELLAVSGVGAKGLRALAMVAELTYGEPASVRDPASFAWAHGGKDGTPFPVDRTTYDATIQSLRKTVEDAKVGSKERTAAMKRLARIGQ